MATSYLDEIDALPPEQKWPRARQHLFGDPLPFFAELRERRPVLTLPEVTLVTRFFDCSLVLRRHEVFGVDLYKPKQGQYFMAQDDTAAHWREKSVMRALLDREDLPEIRKWVAQKTKSQLDKGKGRIDLIPDVSRAVPIALVQERFGFSGSKAAKLKDWSYWNQEDAFWNQPFDTPNGRDQSIIIANRERSLYQMSWYLALLVARRYLADLIWLRGKDPVSRLVRLKRSGAVKFSLKDVVLNSGGLLIGAVETTSHAVANALRVLLDRPDLLQEARAAALADDVARFDGYVFEALRFKPAFPYFFRTCHRATPLASGTPYETVIEPGTTVLAVTHSAMFDATAFPNPDRFDPQRDLSDAFTFGQGLHECLGIAIAGVMVPEIVRQIVCRPELTAEGKPDYAQSSVPEHWVLRYGSRA